MHPRTDGQVCFTCAKGMEARSASTAASADLVSKSKNISITNQGIIGARVFPAAGRLCSNQPLRRPDIVFVLDFHDPMFARAVRPFLAYRDGTACCCT